MSRRSLSHLSDPALRVALKVRAAGERTSTSDLVAHIAEYDARKLYLPDGFPSMLAYAVAELQLSEDAAGRRITAARVARRFPVVLDAMDEGRLNLTTVGLLAPHLTEDNALGLFEEATGRTKADVQHLLAARFPRSEMLARVAEVPASPAAGSDDQHALARVDGRGTLEVGLELPVPEHALARVEVTEAGQTMLGTVAPHALARVDRRRVRPLSARSFEVQFTMGEAVHAKLRYAQELLSHQVPSGDIAEVFERALDALIPQLEKARFAATSHPRRGQPRATANPRHLPAHVRRAVWARDGGQCTFVSESGRRCSARKFIQFDHVLEVARGGEATVDGLRLRCRGHNQYTAERTFGAGFMERKRQEARRRQERLVRRQAECLGAPVSVAVTTPSEESDVVRCLRQLGFRADEVRRAVAACEALPDASLERQVRFALSYLRPPHHRIGHTQSAAT